MTPGSTSREVVRGVFERWDKGQRVLEVRDPNSLTQAIGWLKFALKDGEVFYRGQTSMHAEMSATGLRTNGVAARERHSNELRQLIDTLYDAPCTCDEGPFPFGSAHRCPEQVARGHAGSLVTSTYRAAVEPLLQHFGVRTRWLDVVDNVWVALWFACYRQIGSDGYAYHLRRSVAQDGSDASAYIAVLSSGDLRSTAVPGYRIGSKTRVIDLRYCVPSVYLRPHAQHGMLIAPSKLPPESSGSLTDRVAAHIEVKLTDALAWLGSGGMTSAFVLFPPAARDEGYKRLLSVDLSTYQTLGHITTYGPGF